MTRRTSQLRPVHKEATVVRRLVNSSTEAPHMVRRLVNSSMEALHLVNTVSNKDMASKAAIHHNKEVTGVLHKAILHRDEVDRRRDTPLSREAMEVLHRRDTKQNRLR